MTRLINDYMTVGEAAYRWGISIETVRNRLKPSIKGNKEKIERMVDEGLIRYSYNPDSEHGIWIISTKAMEQWYGIIKAPLE